MVFSFFCMLTFKRCVLCGIAILAANSATISGGEGGLFESAAQKIVNKWKCRAGNDFCRAGNPKGEQIVSEAFPSQVYTGYYTGGGAALYGRYATAFKGEPRRCDEGTFGVDYAPGFSRVRMQWFHGKKHQAGEGQYEADRRNNPFANFAGFGPYRGKKSKQRKTTAEVSQSGKH